MVENDLTDLISRHNSIKDIPDELLEEIGYLKIEVEDGYRIIRKGSDYKELHFQELDYPFDRLNFELYHTEVKSDIPEERAIEAKRKLQKLNRFFDQASFYMHNFPDIIPKTSPLWRFLKALGDYLKETHNPIELDKLEKLFYIDPKSDIPGRETYDFGDIIEYFDSADYEEGGRLPAEVANKVKIELERSRGMLTDISEIEKEWDKGREWLLRRYFIDIFTPQNEAEKLLQSPNLGSLLADQKSTVRDCYTIYLCRFFSDRGFVRVAENLKSSKSFKEMREALSQVKNRDLPSSEEEKRLKKAIKEADSTQKYHISKDLKIAKERIKQERDMINGVLEFLSPYKFYIQTVNKRIKSIQSLLTWGSKQGVFTYHMLGSPHTQYDKDPGIVSGDCTAGRPLPFYDGRIHNIKILDSEDNHVGNIYLVYSTEYDNPDNLVWHLDAIQIPISADWDKGTKEIVEKISGEAKRKNVNCITTNQKDIKISNYDFIQDAVIRFHENSGLGNINLNVPELPFNEEFYSNIQGTGEDSRVLWKYSQE